jgi:cell wall-associated NlpC family hydrolase
MWGQPREIGAHPGPAAAGFIVWSDRDTFLSRVVTTTEPVGAHPEDPFVPAPLSALAIRAAVIATTTAAALVTALPAAPGDAAGGPTPQPAQPVSPPSDGRVLAAAAIPSPAVSDLPAPAPAVYGIPAPFAPTNPTPTGAALAAAPAPGAAPTTADAAAAVPVAQATPAVSGGSAMNRALSKVGSPYRWGATGPNAFDCSGLVTWAYKSSGVALPRTSQAMSRVGTPVSRTELRPGDLVFFYRPVSHVGIYIGDGKIVHASSRKNPVKISDMSRMRYNSARRV